MFLKYGKTLLKYWQSSFKKVHTQNDNLFVQNHIKLVNENAYEFIHTRSTKFYRVCLAERNSQTVKLLKQNKKLIGSYLRH